MTDFETVLICALIPIAYILTYIAGKYDILSLICKMLEEKAKQYKDNKDD